MPAEPTREEHAKRYLEHTVVSRGTAWTLTLLFLLTLAVVPVVQHVVEIRGNLQARREDPEAAGRVLPQSWDVFSLLLSPTVDAVEAYETALEENSAVSDWLLPRAQGVLTGALGAGNEQVYPGRGGWLHYRPDVDYVTGPGFLDPARLRNRRRAGEGAQPDPVRALARFNAQLAERGIVLVVVPTPVKTMIHPETLSPRYDRSGAPLQNPSWPAFARAMERERILMFDPTPVLADAGRRTGAAPFLRTDTHWTPDAMQRVAESLAGFLRARVPELNGPPVAYRRAAPRAVESAGDIALMLQVRGPAQRVRIHPVRAPAGEAWRPSRRADILLLGDSFSNVYSLPGMGWGAGAGFAEQLSVALQRPLDRIAINAGGAYAARQRLRGDLLRGKDPLRGKRVVLYQFAMRDLAFGDWKLLDLPPVKPGERNTNDE